jgi:hypothetical protein
MARVKTLTAKPPKLSFERVNAIVQREKKRGDKAFRDFKDKVRAAFELGELHSDTSKHLIKLSVLTARDHLTPEAAQGKKAKNQAVVARIARIARKQRRRGKRFIAAHGKPYDGTDRLIDQFEKTGKVSHRALLRELTIAKFYHEDFGEGPDAKTRFTELIDIIAPIISKGPLFAQEKAERNKESGARNSKHWQALADEKWKSSPSLSKKRVAELIAKEEGGNADTIRRAISKK